MRPAAPRHAHRCSFWPCICMYVRVRVRVCLSVGMFVSLLLILDITAPLSQKSWQQFRVCVYVCEFVYLGPFRGRSSSWHGYLGHFGGSFVYVYLYLSMKVNLVSISQSFCQLISQSISQSIRQSISQFLSRSISQWAGHSTSQSSSKSISQFIMSQPVNWQFISQSVSEFFSWPISQSVVSIPIYQFVGQFGFLSATPSAS